MLNYLRNKVSIGEAEILDINEEKYREGLLEVKLYGMALTLIDPIYTQASKQVIPISESEYENKIAIAKYLVENIEPDALYILGPGTTVKAICDFLGLEKTLLGVDILYKGRIVAKDVDEKISKND